MPQENPAVSPSYSSKALIVLGMHRSGTSAFTGVLHRLGVELGGRLLPASKDNERGYYEHQDLMVLNESILQKLGTNWYGLGTLRDKWWKRGDLEEFRDRARQILVEELAVHPVWGMKDPRLCRLLPFYLPLLEELGAAPCIVLTLREPLEVAASLARRDNFSVNRGLNLWLRYVLDAERHSRQLPRVISSYDRLLSDWRTEVSRLDEMFSLGFHAILAEGAEERVDGFLSYSLRHHRSSDTGGNASLLEGVTRAVCEQMAGDGVDEGSALWLDNLRGEFDELQQIHAPTAGTGGGGEMEPPPDPDAVYQVWRNQHALKEVDGTILAEHMMLKWRQAPAFHLVTVVPRSKLGLLAGTIESLGQQLYSGWGLSVIADQPAPDEAFVRLPNLEWRVMASDPLSELNAVVQESTAHWMLLLDPGDTLEPDGLARFGDYIHLNREWQILYSDEDQLDVEGAYRGPRFKPDFNLDLLRSSAYMGSVLVRREALVAAGGFTAVDVMAGYDLTLRVLDSLGERAIGHVPRLLMHRHVLNDRSQDREWNEAYCRAAVETHLARNGIAAHVGPGLLSGTRRVNYQHREQPMVSILVANRDRLELLRPCLESVFEKTAYPAFEIVVADGNSEAEDTFDFYREMDARYPGRLRVLEGLGDFNQAVLLNRAAGEARGAYLLLLATDTVVVQPEWLERMMAHAQRPEVGVVGARLVYPGSDKLVHGGVVLGVSGAADHAFSGLSLRDGGYLGRAQLDQNYSAVSGACLLIGRALFDELGGLDADHFALTCGDVDLCLRVGSENYKVVWTPSATLSWQGGSLLRPLREQGLDRVRDEVEHLQERWLPKLARDPAYNPNLTLQNGGFEVETRLESTWDTNFRDRPRVLAFPIDRSALGEHRVLAPLRALERASQIQAGFAPDVNSVQRCALPSVVDLERLQPDVLFLQSVVHDPYLDLLQSAKRFSHAFRVYDLEDLKTLVPEKNPQRNKVLPDLKHRIRKALASCDRLTVTTMPIAEACRQWVDDVRVLPLRLPHARWGNLVSLRGQSARPRVGWAGAQQHHGDLEILIPVVKATAKEVDWIFFGMCLDELRPYAAEVHEAVPFSHYPEKLASLNLDLAVAPLEYHPFNEAKTNLRLLEYGVMGWPVVCTDILPYRDAPVQRVPNEPEAWVEAIRARAREPAKAALEGERLHNWVERHWMLEDHLQEWLDALAP